MTRRPMRAMLAAVLAAAALAVVIPGAAVPAGAQGGGKCPLNALKKADKPVEIIFWHSMPQSNEEALNRLTDQFNSSQSDVKVSLVNQTTYEDTQSKYIAGLSTGDLPDLVQMEDTALQQMIDTGSVLPVQACVKADKYDLSDHVPRVVDYWTVEDTLWAMPFNVSNPILLYDKAKFRQVGLDPESPPTTLDEVMEASQTLKDSGVVSNAGFGLKMHPWYFEQWLAKANTLYVDNGNGRESRAGAAAFNSRAGREVFTWMSEMVDKGLAVTNPYLGGGAVDNLLGIGSGSHAMTIDSSASLGTIFDVLASGQFPGVEPGVAPMPGISAKGGNSVGGAALYITNKAAPAKQAAAWEYAKFLNEPQSQADWAAATGYVPIRTSAVDLPEVQAAWAEQPGFKVAYDQLLTGTNSLATSGPVIGDALGVRAAVVEAMERMFNEGAAPKAALKSAKQGADAAMQDYNSRVGA
jgi:sn-glycerol 3-phosphate transport system substrate-binding protein